VNMQGIESDSPDEELWSVLALSIWIETINDLLERFYGPWYIGRSNAESIQALSAFRSGFLTDNIQCSGLHMYLVKIQVFPIFRRSPYYY
jgi:hypothetical protein